MRIIFWARQMPRPIGPLPGATVVLFLLSAGILSVRCQAPGDPAAPSTTAGPAVITLEEAIHRAEANEPAYATAVADSKVSALDRSLARGSLLPSVVYHNQALYTQANGLRN